MADPVSLLLAILIAYLLGSLPFAIIVSKLFGLEDPRQFGSGNPGATNVLRSGNKSAAILTLIGDALKGWVAVYIAQTYFPQIGASGIALVGVAAFLGHIYSCFLKFKGGKGVATAIGVLFAMQTWLASVTVAIWILIAILFRYSSLAALVASASAPVIYALMSLSSGDFVMSYILSFVFIAAMLIYKHKKNINNLLNGKESKIGSSKNKAAVPVAATGKKSKKAKK